jgi:hypothetical protein
MQVDSINIDPRPIYSGTPRYLAEKISSSSGTNYYDERERTDTLSREQKNSIVSEKLAGSHVDSPNDLRFQENTPVAKLLDIIKNFNETARVETPQFTKSAYVSDAQFTELSQVIAQETPIGYYVVVDDHTKTSKQKTLKGRFDLVKERIAKTYNLGYRKNNGALVNITA